MAKNPGQPAASDASATSYPKKYWWVVLVILPLTLALLQYQPWKKAGGAAAGSTGGSSVSGNQFLGPAIVGNVSLVINEAAKAGATLDPALLDQLKNAAAQSKEGDHDAAVAKIEQVRAASATLAKLPSLLNNLGVEYLSAGNPVQARKAFEDALQQDPENKAAWAGLGQLEAAPLSPIKVVNFTSQTAFAAWTVADGDPNSWWQSTDGTFPQSFVLELPVEATISELIFNTVNQESAPKDIDIAASAQSASSAFGTPWKAVLAKGDIGQSIKLDPPQVGRWIKLRILSNYGEPRFTVLAHVVIIGKPHPR